MTELKSYLLRIPKDEFEIIEKNAKSNLRSSLLRIPPKTNPIYRSK